MRLQRIKALDLGGMRSESRDPANRAPRPGSGRTKGTRERAKDKMRSPGDTSPMTLGALRKKVGRTQGEIARRTSMSQPQLSRVEKRRDHLVSTLRKYVHALGGEIEVIAVIHGSRILLNGV
jgi:hypothetical protein